MSRVSEATEMLLATGHQRHYSILYANAVDQIKRDILGDLHHIRAQWHRNNRPGADSWALPIPGGERTATGGFVDQIAKQLKNFTNAYDDPGTGARDRMKLAKQIAQWRQLDADQFVDANKYVIIKLNQFNEKY